MVEKPLLVLGTGNRKKAVELDALFDPVGLRLLTLADVPESIEVVEDGMTFAENARKKAVQQARHLGRWVLGEDSGLAVDSLGVSRAFFRPVIPDPTQPTARTTKNCSRPWPEFPSKNAGQNTFATWPSLTRGETLWQKARRSAEAESLAKLAARTGSATTRCLKWSNITARLHSSGLRQRPL